MKTVNDIRSEFISYFVKQGHTHVPSSSLVPQNDPTMMFTNSGMVQFKDIFTGKEKRSYSRATTAQKCVRAGGKHNDLDNVGYTERHLTFFEMLGNFSFGDYFKSDAIPFAWELVTKNLGIDKSKLLVTVYHTDDEAADLWKKVAGFDDKRIIRIKTNDNFWMMGDTGPCGPCSEMFYDKGEHIPGGPPGSPDEDGDRFMEFYNLVFMQYEQEPDGQGGYNRRPLPKPSIDTGMGLDRTATLLQGKLSVFEIDLLAAIINHIEELVGKKETASHRVIADHLRSSAFLLADGVMPSNEGRGYVLRRIMRRGMRHAHILGAKDPLMYQLFPTLLGLMGQAYPELGRAQALITETLKNEEQRFKRTLDRGLKLLDEETASLKSGGQLSGDAAFKLYDTYGFPVDLTADALKAKGMTVDMPAFEAAMEKQKETARASWVGTGDATNEKLWFDILDEVGPTEFLGYSTLNTEAKIVALVKDGKRIEEICELDDSYETVDVVFNQTPFYAESGGQTTDYGLLWEGPSSLKRYNLFDVRKKAGGKLWVHALHFDDYCISEGAVFRIEVNKQTRRDISAHHSATHLLHEALRRKLGDHIAQKGSQQRSSGTRFDISHPVAITAEELKDIEAEVNREILANTEVTTRVMSIEEAMETGARALFGDKYGDEVRVVSMGTMKEGSNKPYSVELCGGTHVERTGEIGLFKIISESAVSSGVRRIEAVVGNAALEYFNDQEQKLRHAADLLKTTPTQLTDRVQALQDQNRKLEQELSNLRRQMATGGSASNASDVKEIGGVKFTGKVLEGFPAKDLKPMVDDLKKKLGSGVITLIATEDGKASIVVGVTDDLVGKYSAVDLVKRGVEALGGKGGGGRPDMAQGGGPDVQAANDAVTAVEKALA